MIRWLTRILSGAAERCLGDLLIALAVAAAAALFAIVGLAFGTFAAYVHFAASEGPVVAAIIVGAFHGLLAVTICMIGLARRRSHRLRAATASASPGNVDQLLKSLTAAGAPLDQQATVAALQLGRELSPMQLLTLALIGGFIAGRKLGK